MRRKLEPRRAPATRDALRRTTRESQRRDAPPPSEPADSFAGLQSEAGNRAVVGLLSAVQAKLKVGTASDPYEIEADAVAREVVARLRNTGQPVASVTPEAQDQVQQRIGRIRSIGRRAEVGAAGGSVDADTEAAINSVRGGGASLDNGARTAMESGLGADCSRIRVHAGASASALHDRVQAKAFTIGSDIFFGKAIPDTPSGDGQELLAHELTHTIQQGGAPAVARSVHPAPVDSRTIRRRFGRGYYVVCRPDAEGAILIENDKDDPKRYYRTVASVSSKATKASNQPFKLWSLYDDPEVDSLQPAGDEPDVDESTTDESTTDDVEGTEAEIEEEGDESVEAGSGASPTASGGASASKKKRKKKKKKVPAAMTVVAAAKAEPDAPQEAWIGKYRATTKLKGAVLEQNLAYLKKELKGKTTALEKAVTELNDVWLTDLETGLEATTLVNRQGELWTAMPRWDGAESTSMAKFVAMDKLVGVAKAAVTEVKALGALKLIIGAAGLTDMLSVFGPADVLSYAKKTTDARLATLLTTRAVPAAALEHYGAPLMATFTGTNDALWTHLVTPSLNAEGVVSGGHDEAGFKAFIKAQKYKISGAPVAAPVYRVQYEDEGGAVKGSKTLIQNLEGERALWMPRFETAAWRAVANMRLSDGSFTCDDGNGQNYAGYYTKGNKAVTTMWPT
jgi:hypothetical protein